MDYSRGYAVGKGVAPVVTDSSAGGSAVMEWLVATVPSNTPNLTPASLGFGIYQVVDSDGILNAVEPKQPASLNAYYALQVGDRFKVDIDFSQPIAFYVMATNTYGYDNLGAKTTEVAGADDGMQLIVMLQQNESGFMAQFSPQPDGGTDARALNSVSQKTQDYLVVEYVADGEMYLTFFDGIRTRVYPNYHNLTLNVGATSKGDGTYYPIQPINVTRL